MSDLRTGESWPEYLRRKDAERRNQFYRDVDRYFDKLRRARK